MSILRNILWVLFSFYIIMIIYFVLLFINKKKDMYPLFYREYTYAINIDVDEFLKRMDEDLFLTSSNAYRHEKYDRIDKYLPLQGEIDKKRNKIKGITPNESHRGAPMTKIELEYSLNNDKINIKFTFFEPVWFYLLFIFLMLLFSILILPIKGFLIFLLIFFPLLLLINLSIFFMSIKTILKTFEEYFNKNKIEIDRNSIIKYSILDYILKKKL